ncbi:MAG: DUF4097 family beta strand repeat-containing protein, partial [Dehalococcoidia bacterium]
MISDNNPVWTLPFGEQAELLLESDVVPVSLIPLNPGDEPRLVLSGEDADRVEVEVHRQGDRVRVRVRRQGHPHFSFGNSDALVSLFVPAQISASIHADAGSIAASGFGPCELELTTDAGRISIRDSNGHLRLSTDAGLIEGRNLGPCHLEMRTDAGRISLEEAHGQMRLSSSAGKITGERLSGSIDAQTDVGSIRLGIAGLTPGSHRVRTSAGSIRIDLAPDLDVKVVTAAGLGSAKSSYPSRSNSETVLHVSADLGSVKVRAAEVEMPRGARQGIQRHVEDVRSAVAAGFSHVP